MIVDLSKASVGSDATNPWTVERLLKVAQTKKLATLHAKIFVFDKKAIIGSANLSWNAFSRRIEVGVVIDEDEAVKTIVKFFEKIWNDAEEVSIADLEEMKTHWKKMAQTRSELQPFESVQIKLEDFSKNEEDIRKLILDNKPDIATTRKRQ